MTKLPPVQALPRTGGQPAVNPVNPSLAAGNSIKGGFKHLGVKAAGLKGTWAAFIKEKNND